MSIEQYIPETVESFKAFRSDFELSNPNEKLNECNSMRGRLISLGRFGLSPVSIPAILIKRVCSFVASLFEFIGRLFAMLDFRQSHVKAFKQAALTLLDRFLTLVSSPITLTAEKMRYLAGSLFHPKIVYTPANENNIASLILRNALGPV
jgi:hypothetical protein